LRVISPQVLQLGHLRDRNLSSSELFGFCRDLDEPGEKGAIIDDSGPLRSVPIYVFGTGQRRTGLTIHQSEDPSQYDIPSPRGEYSPAEKDDDSVTFGGNEAEHEDVFAPTVVACRQVGDD
jgi:hypothetical protein